jgi:hypothetical protein
LQELEVTSEEASLHVVVQYVVRRTGEPRTEVIERGGV